MRGCSICLLRTIGRLACHRGPNLLVNEGKVSGRGGNGRRVKENDANRDLVARKGLIIAFVLK